MFRDVYAAPKRRETTEQILSIPLILISDWERLREQNRFPLPGPGRADCRHGPGAGRATACGETALHAGSLDPRLRPRRVVLEWARRTPELHGHQPAGAFRHQPGRAGISPSFRP